MLVIQTVGMNERTWIDNAGRPHSKDLRVEERFHRVDHDNMELTVTIDEPKMYTEPWLALNKYHKRPAGEETMGHQAVPNPKLIPNSEEPLGRKEPNVSAYVHAHASLRPLLGAKVESKV